MKKRFDQENDTFENLMRKAGFVSYCITSSFEDDHPNSRYGVQIEFVDGTTTKLRPGANCTQIHNFLYDFFEKKRLFQEDVSFKDMLSIRELRIFVSYDGQDNYEYLAKILFAAGVPLIPSTVNSALDNIIKDRVAK